MPQPDDTKQRLAVDIRKDQYNDLNALLPWGVKRRLFEVVVDDLIDLLKNNKELVIGSLSTGRLRFTLEKRENGTTT